MEAEHEKPFVLFCGIIYYARPGWRDYEGSYATQEIASTRGMYMCGLKGCDWWQVVDLRQRAIVAGGGASEGGLFGKECAYLGVGGKNGTLDANT